MRTVRLHYFAAAVATLLLFALLITPSQANAANAADKEETHLVPIIMYHRVFERKNGEYCITPQEFESDLVYLKQNGYTTMTVAQLIDFKQGRFKMPQKPVILTFDDCHYNNYTHVFPLLKKHGAKASFYVIGSFSQRFSDGREQNPQGSHLSLKNIKEMAQSDLCDFGNHTYDLHDWRYGRRGIRKKEDETDEEYKKILTADVLKTQKLLKKAGVNALSFAYPFGVYSPQSPSILKGMGFKAILTTDQGINLVSKNYGDMFSLRRINRPHGVKSEDFFAFNT